MKHCKTRRWHHRVFLPPGPLGGIHHLRAKGSESSCWAKQPTSSLVTGSVIAEPVSSLSWLDPPVPSGLFQWGWGMGRRWNESKGVNKEEHFLSHCRPDLLSSWGLEKCFWLAGNSGYSLWVAVCAWYAGDSVGPLNSYLQMAGPELTVGSYSSL